MAKRKDKKVIFRRIRGRVVPIRVKESAEGAALIGAGAAVGIAGAILSGRGLGRLARTQTRLTRTLRKATVRGEKIQKDLATIGRGKNLIKKGTPAKRKFAIKRREEAILKRVAMHRRRTDNLLRKQVKIISSARLNLAAFGAGAVATSFLAQAGAEKIAKSLGAGEGQQNVAGTVASSAAGSASTAVLLGRLRNKPIQKVILKTIERGGRMF